jgi:hypothetical protein
MLINCWIAVIFYDFKFNAVWKFENRVWLHDNFWFFLIVPMRHATARADVAFNLRGRMLFAN